MKMKLSTSLIAIPALLAFMPLAQAQIKTVSVASNAGVPTSGTNEIQTLTIAASTSGGTFTLTVLNGRTTGPITWSATNATLIANVDTAVERLSAVGVGGVTTAVGTLSSGIGTITLTFIGKNAKMDFPALSVSNNLVTGGTTPTIATTAAGVAATFKDAPTGTLLVDTTTPDLYINDSTTAGSPTWTKVSP